MRALSAIFASALALAFASAASAASFASQVDAAFPVSAPTRALGRDDAPITLEIYASFACQDCASWFQTVLPSLTSDYIDPGRMRLVFKDAPSEPYSVTVQAAMIGVCAEPNRFFEVAGAFWEGLPDAIAGGSIEDWFARARAASGLSSTAMDACLEDERIYEMVRLQNAEAIVANVTSLPAVTLNGRLLDSASFDSIRVAIETENSPDATPSDD